MGFGRMTKIYQQPQKQKRTAVSYFFSLRNMRRETDPIELEHNIETPIFAFPFAWLTNVCLATGNVPLSQGALEGLPQPARTGSFPCFTFMLG